MSKKKIVNKKLKKGKLYLHNDKNGGHPAMIYKKNDNKNIYKSIQFTSEPGLNRTQLKHNIDSSSKKKSYVINYPIVDKRRGFGSKELKGLKIHKEDKPLINKIKRKNK